MAQEQQDITKIQRAVNGSEEQGYQNDVETAFQQNSQEYGSQNSTEITEDQMQPSIMQTSEVQPVQPQNPYQSYSQPPYDANAYQDQSAYANYSGINADTISEIAEQTVAERLSKVRDSIDEMADFRATAEAKLTDLNERIKKIESVIDRLQLSILQKVGEYVANTEDIKNELHETQKSFKTLLPELKLKTHSPQMHQNQHQDKKHNKEQHPHKP